MRILVSSIVRQHPVVLEAHLKTVLWQEAPEGVTLDYYYINDLDIDDPNYKQARDVLFADDRIVVENTDPNDRHPEAAYAAGETTHTWNIETFRHLGRLKQKLLDKVIKDDYQAILLVDSDLLLEPGTLRSLYNCGEPVVSGVFWTRWSPEAPPLPQVWQRHPYEMEGGRYTEEQFMTALGNRDVIPCAGLGACTLIKRAAIEKGVGYWPFMPGLPMDGMWQGEDRHFCIKAQRLHVRLIADAWPDIYHVYRPSMYGAIPKVLDLLTAPKPQAAAIGHYVSFMVQPLEEPKLPSDTTIHVRGRLGTLKMLPEIEQDLLDMPIGESAITRLHYPAWYPLPAYRGQTKLVRVTLLDVKEYLPNIALNRVASQFDDRYYTPGQLQVMGNK